MPDHATPREGQVLRGPLFSEPMRVETVRANGRWSWVVGLVGTQSERFRKVTLTGADLEGLTVLDAGCTFDGDGRLLRLGLQAYALGIAYEFDPYFGLSISRVDPLPHQLEAVYDYLLKLARVRFLLADDAGAGKTIMAGLLIRELELRGLAERILIVCPANLAFQWQRELKEKFDAKFLVLKGQDIRDQFGVNQWLERNRVITSLDLAKREDILPGLRQVHWDLVIVDEAHRMSAADESHKSLRYKLGELLRDTSDHLLLLTATPHKGDPENFSLFLQLLDADCLRRREIDPRGDGPPAGALLPAPHQGGDGLLPRAAGGRHLGRRADLHQAHPAHGGLPDRRRGVRPLPRRDALREARERPRRGRGRGPARARDRLPDVPLPAPAGLEHLRHAAFAREPRTAPRRGSQARAGSRPPGAAGSPRSGRAGGDGGERARAAGGDARGDHARGKRRPGARRRSRSCGAWPSRPRRSRMRARRPSSRSSRTLLQKEGFFDHPDQRLLLFTEFKDTLDYLVERLKSWGFRVGCIHGGMKSGSRDEPGTRLHAEQQFREGEIQVLVATEAAGEGINLQVCNILFNYDIPWNPNRLEQRMGRIHRYGQRKDCLIFNFVATNTIEGRVLQRLLEKLQEIRDALDDDAVFNVVGEVLPAAHVERVLRDYYAGKLGDADLEERLLRDVDEGQFRAICQNALEGLASKKLNLEMLIERRARAQERRVVPETIARFLREAAEFVPLTLKTIPSLPHAFEPARTPSVLRRYEKDPDWKLPPLADRYPRCSTDREAAEKKTGVGHARPSALRGDPAAHARAGPRACSARAPLSTRSSTRSPARIDFYRARVVDGLGQVVHERLFAWRMPETVTRGSRSPACSATSRLRTRRPRCPRSRPCPRRRPGFTSTRSQPFLEETRKDRLAEVERVAAHVELSLTELLQRADEEIGRAA